ncbi:MAG: recombinase family protein [Candidatus Sedimenticola sp. 20ELBAFRAG]
MSESRSVSDKKVINNLKSGNYRNCYLVYNRKSTDEADNQKNSIDYQKKENISFAKRETLKVADISIDGLCVNGVISERHSGFKESGDLQISEDGVVKFRIDRPKFQRLVQLINQGHIKGMICLCWDRISRNKADDTVIRKLMKKGADIRFVHAQYANSSAGELHMDIDGMFAQHHSRVTSEKVRLSTRNSRSQGKCTYRAPIGYLNEGNMDHKPFDPERALKVKELFELYATGDWSLADLQRHTAKQGLTAPPMRRHRTKEEMLADEDIVPEKVAKPIQRGYLAKILRNQFYIGKVKRLDGGYIDSISHEPLVSVDVFNRVQDLLSSKNVSRHYTEKIDYPLRGVLRCAHCHRVYTPYKKKGVLYFNSRCVDGCTNTVRNCNFAHVSDKVREVIVGLHLSEQELEMLDSRASTDIALLEHRRMQEFERMDRQKKSLRGELAYLREHRLQLLKEGVYTPSELVGEQTKLETELDGLRQDEAISEEAIRGLIKDVVKLSELLKGLVPTYDFADPYEKEKIIRAIFSELSISQDTLKFKLEKGLAPFETRIVDLCGQKSWLSELYRDREYIWLKVQALQSFSDSNVLDSVN